jgi:amidase
MQAQRVARQLIGITAVFAAALVLAGASGCAGKKKTAPAPVAAPQAEATPPPLSMTVEATPPQPPAPPASSTRVTAGATAPRAEVSMSNVKRPTLAQMKDIVTSLHMSMSDREIGEYLDVMEATFQAYDRLQQLPDHLPPVRYPRTPGSRPSRHSRWSICLAC